MYSHTVQFVERGPRAHSVGVARRPAPRKRAHHAIRRHHTDAVAVPITNNKVAARGNGHAKRHVKRSA